jgi:hypothetical protein
MSEGQQETENDMANIREGAARTLRPNVQPWAVGLCGFLTATMLLMFYWEAEAADRAAGNLWPRQASASAASTMARASS